MQVERILEEKMDDLTAEKVKQVHFILLLNYTIWLGSIKGERRVLIDRFSL